MTMTSRQLEGLGLLGYSPRQSEFLFLVATHSGYFTARQFQAFARTESGGASHTFFHKLLKRRHADYHSYRSGGRVYHLFARRVYQAIEREDLCTRAKHELEYIKTRLVALDFVLQNPQYSYLETEAEKVALFESEWNVGREHLPTKRYRARGSSKVALRHFVDRFPLFMRTPAFPPVVTFTYIEAGAVSLSGFDTHLRCYRALLHSLPHFEFLYIAPTDRLFRSAQAEFYHIMYGRREGLEALDLLHYFRVRRAWDLKERVASADVLFLKVSQPLYGSKKFTDLYEKWRQGAATDPDVVRAAGAFSDLERPVFRTVQCGKSLTLFNDSRRSSTETLTEPDLLNDSSEFAG
ncbi:MAG: hypothetical protein WCA38_13985 [Candidatus Acidiferrales bacterium]